ncbi:hypothetical protein ACK11Z_16215 [Methanoculleus bourgensis]|uniref:hypothetical protein n=1 Tax=Methanoculleus bourgensis TaxID=83986 RepID=UPI003B92DB72
MRIPVNTTTTCKTGPPQGQRPAHARMPIPEETGRVWIGAPLHHPATDRESAISLPGHRWECRIRNPGRLRRIALDYGIEPAGRGDDGYGERTLEARA